MKSPPKLETKGRCHFSLAYLFGICVLLNPGHVASGRAEAAPPEAWLVTGETRPGELVAANGPIFFLEDGGKQWQCHAQQLVFWGTLPEPMGPTWLCLRNGSLISGSWENLTAKGIKWKHETLGELQFPRAACAAVILRLPYSLAARDKLLDAVAAGPEGIFFSNGDVLSGKLDDWSGQSSVRVRSELGEQEIDLSRLVAVRFGDDEFPGKARENEYGLRVWVGLKDGSRLLLSLPNDMRQGEPSISAPANREETSETIPSSVVVGVCGSQILRIPVRDICFLQVLGGQAVYLSDLLPEQYIHVPFLEYVRPFYRDRNAKGGFLRAQGSVFLKGIGVYSACRLSYRLNKAYSRFESEVGIDEVAGTGGSVVFVILVDGVRRAEIGPMRGGEPPRHVAVDVTAAERLDLIVEFGERADELDYADWLNARLVPRTISKE